VTSPFIDRVEFDVIGRDRNASETFRRVADEADRAGDRLGDLRGEVDGLADDFDRAGDGADRFADGLGDIDANRSAIANLRSDFDQLAGDVDTTSTRVRDLVTAMRDIDQAVGDGNGFGRLRQQVRDLEGDVNTIRTRLGELTGDIDRLNDIRILRGARVDESFLAQLGVVREQLRRIGEDSGSRYGLGFAHYALLSIGAVMNAQRIASFLRASIGPSLAGGIASALASAGIISILGSIVGGAILGGIGLGGVIGGLIAVRNDPDVKKAAKEAGDAISAMLASASASFVPVTVAALQRIKEAAWELRPEFERIFSAASEWVEPLTEGLIGFLKELLPDLADAMESLDPVMEVIAKHLPKLGDAVGDFLKDITDEDLETFTKWLDRALTGVENLIRFMGDLFSFFAKFAELVEAGPFKVIEAIWNFLKWLVTTPVTRPFDALREAMGQLSGPAESLGRALGTIMSSIDRLGAAARLAAGYLGGLVNAARNLAGLLGSLIPSFSGVRGAIDALLSPLRSIPGLLGSLVPSFGGLRGAIDAFLGPLRSAVDRVGALSSLLSGLPGVLGGPIGGLGSLGAAAAAAAAKAADLIAKLSNIPSPVATVKLLTGAAESALQALLRPRTMRVVVNFIRGALPSLPGFSEGGAVFGPGPRGRDSVSAMLAPGEHVWTAREVDAAGGHKAVEAMRRATLDGGSSSATPVRAARRGGSNVDALTLRRALSGMTLVIDDRTGRTAQLIARGG